MEKSKQTYKNYISISQNEAFLLSLVKTHDLTVFGVNELRYLSKWQNTLAKTV